MPSFNPQHYHIPGIRSEIKSGGPYSDGEGEEGGAGRGGGEERCIVDDAARASEPGAHLWSGADITRRGTCIKCKSAPRTGGRGKKGDAEERALDVN